MASEPPHRKHSRHHVHHIKSKEEFDSAIRDDQVKATLVEFTAEWCGNYLKFQTESFLRSNQS